jgi:diguanylate cyclase (GGDEF)-like protein
MKSLNEEMARAQRTGVACSAAIIDIDFFKRINDQFGHPAGDEALRTFAVTLFANIRTIDKLGRYGGEEFLLILPDTAKDQAVRTLDRLRSIVSEVDWVAISGIMNLTIAQFVKKIQPPTFWLAQTLRYTVRKTLAVIGSLQRSRAELSRLWAAERNDRSRPYYAVTS